MKYIEHETARSKAIEILADEVIIQSEQDALDLMATIGYLYESRKIILHRKNLCDAFFNLSSGIAGSIMQKFSNYRFQAAIIGDFSDASKSMKALITESNRTKQFLFKSDLSEALYELR